MLDYLNLALSPRGFKEAYLKFCFYKLNKGRYNKGREKEDEARIKHFKIKGVVPTEIWSRAF